ncbi:hypothetical protein HJFPF1_09432 [Paramyrothecium foliicola]|nr:hypothetical protein HJFPF1_09432 [Paramyrothecium foliicola]
MQQSLQTSGGAAPALLPPPSLLHSPSVRHPVFFTERYRKMPVVGTAMGPSNSPITHGYAFPEAFRTTPGGGVPKL